MSEKIQKSKKKGSEKEPELVSVQAWVTRAVQTDSRLNKKQTAEILVFLKKQGLEDKAELKEIEEAFKRF